MFFCWSRVERELDNAIDAMAGGKKVHGISHKLVLWKTLLTEKAAGHTAFLDTIEAVNCQLCDALDLRNRVAHGQDGIFGDIGGDMANAYIKTNLNDKSQNQTMQAIIATNETLDRIARSLGDFTFMAHKAASERSDLLVETRSRLTL